MWQPILYTMHKLIYFIKKIYVPAIFIILELTALICYSTSSPYSQSRLMSINHYITGWSGGVFMQMRGYFHLRKDNVALNERIAELENRLNAYRALVTDDVEIGIDLQSHQYITGKVVCNSLNRPQNYIVINRGLNDGVRIGTSVLSPEGYAVGYITNCSQSYSIAQSILNTSFNVSSRLTKDRSMGLVSWRGGDPYTVEFTDVSKYAQIAVGDTVEAIDFSEYFPSGTIIGTIESLEMNEEQTMYNCTLRLAADIARIDNVILVDGRDIDEVRNLKKHTTPSYLMDEEEEEDN